MLLITPAEVIRHAFSSRERISPDSIRPLKIDIAQEHFIRPRLGDELFEKMVEGSYPDFVDQYLNPALAHFVRYGLIPELCVEVGDRGALVYSASSGKTQTARSQESTAKQTKDQNGSETFRTTCENQTTTQETTNTTVTYEEHIVANQPGTSTVLDQVEDSESYTNRIQNGTKNNQGEETRESNDESQEVLSNNAESSLDENRSASDEVYRPATGAELRALSVRTLSDAHILLAKAVRYLNRHSADFVEYAPTTLSQNVFF